jgi:hypothetical protein
VLVCFLDRLHVCFSICTSLCWSSAAIQFMCDASPSCLALQMHAALHTREQALGLSARLEEAAQSARTHARAQAAGAAGSQSAAVVASQVAAIRAESAASVSVYDLTQQAQLLQQPPQQPVSASRLSLIASPVFAQGRAAVVCAVRALSYHMRVSVAAGGVVSVVSCASVALRAQATGSSSILAASRSPP